MCLTRIAASSSGQNSNPTRRTTNAVGTTDRSPNRKKPLVVDSEKITTANGSAVRRRTMYRLDSLTRTFAKSSMYSTVDSRNETQQCYETVRTTGSCLSTLIVFRAHTHTEGLTYQNRWREKNVPDVVYDCFFFSPQRIRALTVARLVFILPPHEARKVCFSPKKRLCNSPKLLVLIFFLF